MNREELMRLLGQTATELRALDAKSKAGTFTPDDQVAWDALVGKAAELRTAINAFDTRASQAGETLAGIDTLVGSAPASTRAAGTVAPQNAGTTGDPATSSGPDLRSLGRRIIESDAFKDWRSRGGARNGHYSADIGDFYTNGDANAPQLIRSGSRTFQMETRGLVYTGSFPTGAVENDRVPGILQQQYAYARPNVRDVFASSPTTSNLITFVRELLASHTNAAAFVAEPTASGGSSGLKPESALVFDGNEAAVREIATHVPVSENIADDLPGLESLINNRLLDFLAQSEDDAILNGDGNAPNLRGLLNTSGIQVADDTYFSSNPVQDTGFSNEDYNRILAAAMLVKSPGLGMADFVLMHPLAYQYMLTVTDDNRNYLGGGPFVTGAVPRIWGLPIIQTDKLDEDVAVVGDGRMAEIRDRQMGTIDVGYIDDQFIRDMKTIRAKERLAFPVYRPGCFVEVTLALN